MYLTVKTIILLALLSGQASSQVLAPVLPAVPVIAGGLASLPLLAQQAVQNFRNLAIVRQLVEQAEKLLAGDDKNPDKLNPIDAFLLDIVPTYIGQKPNNQNGTKWQYKDYAMKDTSNDDAVKLTGVSCISL